MCARVVLLVLAGLCAGGCAPTVRISRDANSLAGKRFSERAIGAEVTVHASDSLGLQGPTSFPVLSRTLRVESDSTSWVDLATMKRIALPNESITGIVIRKVPVSKKRVFRGILMGFAKAAVGVAISCGATSEPYGPGSISSHATCSAGFAGAAAGLGFLAGLIATIRQPDWVYRFEVVRRTEPERSRRLHMGPHE